MLYGISFQRFNTYISKLKLRLLSATGQYENTYSRRDKIGSSISPLIVIRIKNIPCNIVRRTTSVTCILSRRESFGTFIANTPFMFFFFLNLFFCWTNALKRHSTVEYNSKVTFDRLIFIINKYNFFVHVPERWCATTICTIQKERRRMANCVNFRYLFTKNTIQAFHSFVLDSLRSYRVIIIIVGCYLE